MMALIDGVLDGDDLAAVRRRLEAAQWRDGKTTAGAMARAVKNNRQAARDAETEALEAFIAAALLRHPVFLLAARPARLSRLLFSRYGPGQAYGAHVDDALMTAADGSRLRADVAFTVFLAEPDSYSGGALVIDSPAGEQAVKLAAGAVVVYPAGSVHRVEPVGAGERLAAVGWAQSLVRSAERREILFDLATARSALAAAPREELLRLDRSISALLRQWAEP